MRGFVEAAAYERVVAQVTRLRAEVDFLKGELGLVEDAARAAALRTHFRLYPAEAAALIALYSARHRQLSWDCLNEAVKPSWVCERQSDSSVKVWICRIRRALGANCIETVDRGYRLTAAGIKAVDCALEADKAARRAA